MSDRKASDAAIAFDPATHKLIRDGYEEFASSRVDGDVLRAALLAKLREEVEEAFAAQDEGAIAFQGELGDIVEVCYALGGLSNVEYERERKRSMRGGFDKGLVMRLDERTADGHGRLVDV